MQYTSLVGIFISVIGISFLFYIKKKIKNPYRRSFWSSALLFFMLYLIQLAFVEFFEVYYEWNLNSYDLNDNGNFEWAERTEAQRQAYDKVVNDTGRSFAFITGAIYSFIISFFYLLIDLIRTRLKFKKILLKK